MNKFIIYLSGLISGICIIQLSIIRFDIFAFILLLLSGIIGGIAMAEQESNTNKHIK